ncbi:MAG: hypothetical protein ACR2O8_00285 [Rhizobiaceae bacterium]
MNSERWLGLLFCLFALLLIFVWVPLDTGTGIVEKVRRSLTIGDALAPTVAGVVLLVGGLLTIFKQDLSDKKLSRNNAAWFFALTALFAVSIALMRYCGPIVAEIFSDEDYRPLRATIPWKYIGYLTGGTVLVGGLMSIVRGRIVLMDWIIAFLATLSVALIYDLPFDDLLLPPNGDV